MSGLRYIPALGATYVKMHENMRASPLHACGDCILIWVNEGDFWQINPVDVSQEAKERAEYERLKAKFE